MAPRVLQGLKKFFNFDHPDLPQSLPLLRLSYLSFEVIHGINAADKII